MKIEERLTIESAIVNGYILKGLCTIARDGKATDEMGCPEFCEINDGDCDNCPIQEAFTRLAEYENTGLSPVEIERLKEPLQKLSEIGYCHNFQLERSDLVSWIYAVCNVIKDVKEIMEDNGNARY